MKLSKKLPALLLAGALLMKGTATLAATYASSQTNGYYGTCIGCMVSNPQNSVDKIDATYAKANINFGGSGAYVYQNLKFTITVMAGQYVGVIVEDESLIALNALKLGSIFLTTYYNNMSNNDTKSSTQYTIRSVFGSPSRYIIEFKAGHLFNQVRLQMKAGIVGAVTKLRIYYAYNSVTSMPVSLISFTGEQEQNRVALAWATEKEMDNDYFTIERSTDGEAFETIGTVISRGDSAAGSYHFTDINPVPGTAYYRLSQTDFDGQTTHMDMIEVRFAEENADRFSAYPNPINAGSALTLHIPASESGNAKVSLIDASGRRIMDKEYTSSSTAFQVALPSGITTGVYIVFIATDKGNFSQRLVIM